MVPVGSEATASSTETIPLLTHNKSYFTAVVTY